MAGAVNPDPSRASVNQFYADMPDERIRRRHIDHEFWSSLT
jgi:hypothetical protein